MSGRTDASTSAEKAGLRVLSAGGRGPMTLGVTALLGLAGGALVAGLVGFVRWWDYRRGGDGDAQIPAFIGGVAAVAGGAWTALVLDRRGLRRSVIAGGVLAFLGCALVLSVTVIAHDASWAALLLLGSMIAMPALAASVRLSAPRVPPARRAWSLCAGATVVPLVAAGAALAQRFADHL